MSTEKKPPNLPARIEADVTRDLRAVGGFFKGLLRFTQKAERVVQEAARPDESQEELMRCVGCGSWKPLHVPCVHCRASLFEGTKPIARVGKVEVLPKCEVCGDKRMVGEGKKIPCPVCAKVR